MFICDEQTSQKKSELHLKWPWFIKANIHTLNSWYVFFFLLTAERKWTKCTILNPMYQQGEETDTRWGPEVKLKCRDLSVASHMDKKTIVLLVSFKAELKKKLARLCCNL